MTQLEKNKQGKMLDLNFELQLQKKKNVVLVQISEEWQYSRQIQLKL